MSLALNYEPEVVVNIETLTREEWLDYRRLGIGGSDVAAITFLHICWHLYRDGENGIWKYRRRFSLQKIIRTNRNIRRQIFPWRNIWNERNGKSCC